MGCTNNRRGIFNPLLGVWDKFEEIDFSKLPNKFVLKANHAAGTNIIVPDKSTLNKKKLIFYLIIG